MRLALAALLIFGTSLSASDSEGSSSLALEVRLDPAPELIVGKPGTPLSHTTPARRRSSEPLVSGHPYSLTATVRNTTGKRIPFFIPFNTELPAFLQCRFQGSDGTTYAPWPTSRQFGMRYGIQGSVFSLQPGQSHSIDFRFNHVCKVDPRTNTLDHDSPFPLPPGNYVFSCSHERTRPQVPFRTEPDFSPPANRPEKTDRPRTPDEELEEEIDELLRILDTSVRIQKPIDGLWTGRVAAPPMTVTVTPSPIPSILIEGPREFVAGQSFPLTITVWNPHGTPLELSHGLTLLTRNNGTGHWKAAVELDPKTPVVSAGSHWTTEVDLLRLSFDPRRIDPGAIDAFSIGDRSTIEVAAGSGVDGAWSPLSNPLFRELR